jgi:hypothetical protein
VIIEDSRLAATMRIIFEVAFKEAKKSFEPK